VSISDIMLVSFYHCAKHCVPDRLVSCLAVGWPRLGIATNGQLWQLH